MTYNEILEKVQKLLNGTTEEQFGTATLADGETTVEFQGDAIASGKTLYVMDGQGNRQPAPEGDHTLDGGRVVSVDSEGTITQIQEADSEGGEGSEGSEETGTEIAELRERVSKMEELLKETVETMRETSQKAEEKQREMEKAYEELSKAPASDPSEKHTAEEVFGKSYQELSLSERVQLNLKQK